MSCARAHLAAVGCNGQEITRAHLAATECNGLTIMETILLTQLRERWLLPSVPSVLLESCSTLDLQSVGEVEDGDGNANGKIYTEILHNLIWTSYMMYIVIFVTDETDLHVDSGTTSETVEPTSDPELDEQGQ